VGGTGQAHYAVEMLNRTRLGSGPGFAVEEIRCGRLATPGWSVPEAGSAYMLVFVRVGLFRRRVGGAEAVLDPTAGYWQRPGEEQQVAHPLGDGDVCTAITLSEELLAALAGGVPTVPTAPVLTGDGLDLAYRALTTRARRGAGALELGERVARLAGAALARQLPERVASGRPATAAAHRRLADTTREALTAAPEPLTLRDLARLVGASPYHLSRVFQAETGLSLTRFRNRLRLRRALERLAAGESSLANIATDVGFADHAHFCRAVREQLGHTPAQLRSLLHAGAPSASSPP
jgi:AraC-like DNA-binding protein